MSQKIPNSNKWLRKEVDWKEWLQKIFGKHQRQIIPLGISGDSAVIPVSLPFCIYFWYVPDSCSTSMAHTDVRAEDDSWLSQGVTVVRASRLSSLFLDSLSIF